MTTTSRHRLLASAASDLLPPRPLHRRSFAVRFARTAAWVAATVALAVPARAQTPFVGLSTVGAERFGNENLSGGPFTSPEGDHFAFSLATGDFNGDRVDDLATGMPYADGLADAPILNSGSVVVRYGVSGQGLPPSQAGTVLRQTADVNSAEQGDLFGGSLAACDFNGDLFDDLAVGVPWEDHVGRYSTGGVQIHYGGPNGLPTSGWTFYTQSTPGIPGDAEDYDQFGASLACGDFNHDGFADLVIGVPNEKIGAFRFGAGMVDIVPGSEFGLDASAATYLSQEVEGMGGDAEIGDYFGDGLAAGDFNGDGFDDLAIGSDGEDDNQGAIHLAFGGPSGLTTAGSLFLMETFLGGSSEDDDSFGRQLTSADFDGDGFDDLVIGIPGEDLGPGGSAVDTGRVCVLYGSLAGYDPSRTQFWSEEAILGPGANESGGFFGIALAAGDFDKDGFDDLVASHPGLFVDPGHKDGALTALMGSSAGLSNARRRDIAAGREGFPGDPNQHEESFALAIASGDFDGDGHADLAVGSPHEDDNGLVDAGAETVLYGALFADGLESGSTAIWTQTAGTVGGNRVRAAAAAALGPRTSRFGLQVSLLNPARGVPATPAFVHVGSEAGFHDEATLRGSFFVDPQGVIMSPNPGLNDFQMIVLTDGPARGSHPRLAFQLNRDDPAGGWVIVATSFNENVGSLQFAGGVVLGPINDPLRPHYRIEFEWRAGTSASTPGRLTIWQTRFVDRAPDAAGRVLVGSVDLPGTTRAVINDVSVGMIAGQDVGTSGTLNIDELSFRR